MTDNVLLAVGIGEVTVFSPHGPLMGGATTIVLHAAVEEQIQHGRNKIVVDLSDVPWLNSSGIGTLMGCRARCDESGGGLVLAGVGDRIARMVERLHLTEQLVCHDTVEQAVASLIGR